MLLFPRKHISLNFETFRSEEDGFATPQQPLRRISSKTTPSEVSAVPEISPPKGGGKHVLKGKSKDQILALMAAKGFKGSKGKGKGSQDTETPTGGPADEESEEEKPPRQIRKPTKGKGKQVPKETKEAEKDEKARKKDALKTDGRKGKGSKDDDDDKDDPIMKAKGKGKKVPKQEDEAEEEEP